MVCKRRESVHTRQVAYQAGTYVWFLYHEVSRSTSTPPGWDASPSQGYPQH